MTQNRRPAAVALTIGAREPHEIIFVERAAHLRSHPGQIGLPGGGIDPQDEGDLERTALRELYEEVGIPEDRVQIVWRLTSIRARVNTYDVTPFVAVVDRRAEGRLEIDRSELTGAFTVALDEVLSGLHHGTLTFGSFEVETPILETQGRTIWGLTGHILAEFAAEWNAPSSAMQARVRAKWLPEIDPK